MLDLCGQKLGPFEIKSLIGTGGFATVYLAHDKRLGSDVAIKILADNHALDPVLRERFVAEANALRRIDSPSVVKLYDIRETDDGRPYIVLEYADRGDLVRRRLAKANNGWAPSADDVRCVVDAVADSLEAVHAHELVHRDVTPSNLLIRSGHLQRAKTGAKILETDERLVLADMGLVKDMAAGSGLTVGGGTAGFWAPEQQHSWTKIDHRADIFSATALVRWFLIGESLTNIDGSPAKALTEDWPPAFVDALSVGMATEPDDRHQSIFEWRDELHAGLVMPAKAEIVPMPKSVSPAVPKSVMPTLVPVRDSVSSRKLTGVRVAGGVIALATSAAIVALLYVASGSAQFGSDNANGSDAPEVDSATAAVLDATDDRPIAPTSTVVVPESESDSDSESDSAMVVGLEQVAPAETGVAPGSPARDSDPGSEPVTDSNIEPDPGSALEPASPSSSSPASEPEPVRESEPVPVTTPGPEPESEPAGSVVTSGPDPEPEPVSQTTTEPKPDLPPKPDSDAPAIAAPRSLGISFGPSESKAQLEVVWGVFPVPAEVVRTQIQIATDGGPWFSEIDARFKVSRDGWIQTKVGPADNRVSVRRTSEYRARARYELSDGSTTAWSNEVVLRPEP